MYYAYFHKGWSMSFHVGSDLLGKNKINVHEIIKWVSSNRLTMDMWGIDFVPAAHWDFVLAAFWQGFSQTLAHKKLRPNRNMIFTDRFIRCARPRYHGNRSQCVWVAVALASMYLIQTLSWDKQPKEYCRISAINRMYMLEYSTIYVSRLGCIDLLWELSTSCSWRRLSSSFSKGCDKRLER